MLKPTESPPASLQPRFAASITPGPPPVTTANPASANARPVARALSYVGVPSSTRAEPKIETAGRSIFCTAWNPARNSDAISEMSLASVSWVRRQDLAIELLAFRQLEVPLDVRRRHGEREHGGETEVDDADRNPLPGGQPVVVRCLPALAPAPPEVEPAQDRR